MQHADMKEMRIILEIMGIVCSMKQCWKCGIWGSHSGGYGEYYLLGYKDM